MFKEKELLRKDAKIFKYYLNENISKIKTKNEQVNFIQELTQGKFLCFLKKNLGDKVNRFVISEVSNRDIQDDLHE